MNLNGRLQFQSQQNVQSLEQEANEIATRIVEKVRQRSKVKSAQKELVSQYFRASDYKSRQLLDIDSLKQRREPQLYRQEPQSETTRGNDFIVPEFKTINDKQPYQLIHTQSQKIIQNAQPRQFNFPEHQSANRKEPFQPTVKSNQKKSNITQNIEVQDWRDNLIIVESNKNSSLKKGNLKIANLTHTKSSLSIRTTQLQTPASISDNKNDIVSQLLGSLKNQRKHYAQNHIQNQF